MTSTLALIGKSGSGKTTLVKAFHRVIKKKFPNSSILLLDNDLTLELSDSFNIKTKNTIYGIKSGKHEYKTGIPEGMSKQEFVDWALEDIVVTVDENTDLIASWLVTPKDCSCLINKIMRESLKKFISQYDFVIFDCEYDLKYLNSLVDFNIDEAIITTKTNLKDIFLASKIAKSSRKYVLDGQLGIILNKAKKEELNCASEELKELELPVLGIIEKFEGQEENFEEKIENLVNNFYSRMNLPQNEIN